MKDHLSVAISQITSIDDHDHNLEIINQVFSAIGNQGVDLVLFPENSLFMRLKEGESVKTIDLNSPVIKQLEKIAIEKKCAIHIGASPMNIEGKAFNSSVFISDQGKALATYQKIHLFDIELEGHPAHRESDVFEHGARPNILDIHGWRIGESICYDIRFSELFSYYAQQEVDMILIPAAFLVPTGEAHWEVLLRARAIETQSYVLASAQTGIHQGKKGGKRETYGNSMAIDPWGKVLTRLTKSPEVKILTLHKKEIQKVRAQIPMKAHRKIKVNI